MVAQVKNLHDKNNIIHLNRTQSTRNKRVKHVLRVGLTKNLNFCFSFGEQLLKFAHLGPLLVCLSQ